MKGNRQLIGKHITDQMVAVAARGKKFAEVGYQGIAGVLLIGRNIAVNTVFNQMFGHTFGITVIPGIDIALNKFCGVHNHSLPGQTTILFILPLCATVYSGSRNNITTRN
ncbi:hypothetical protein N9399_07155 [Porticoccaceae bacterium]|nr:hypothetical protein [Porticoccaceae bacterium]